MPVPPQAVWDALADPGGYGYWVVGSSEIRDADPHWPEPGARFHHTVGIRPLRTSDHTESLEAEEPTRLLLRARARPLLGSAQIELTMTPEDGGTRVRMVEHPVGLSLPLAFSPLLQLVTRFRNTESLARLEELAERWVRSAQQPAGQAA